MKRISFLLLYFIFQTSLFLNAQTAPSLSGKFLYHTYSGYENWDSELFILDFSDNSITNISSGWGVDHEMNAVFSPDGTKIVFMADKSGGKRNWDIFLWTIGDDQPVNLTSGSSAREEDPKFSPDGTKIVYKSNNDIYEMDLEGNVLQNVTNTSSIEESMPYYTADGSAIIFAPGVGADSDIEIINVDGTNRQQLVAQQNYQEYYPIVRDSESFFYTGWVSTSDVHDQLYLKYFDQPNPIYLPLNSTDADYSDAAPVGSDYVIFSSTKSGGQGGYDLYIADINSGQTWSMNQYNSALNTSHEDLGGYYFSGSTSSNIPPSVSITSPVDNTSYESSPSITISVNASDSDGTIAKVAFYQNGNLLGEDTVSPYEYTWNNIADGDYVITAKATDNEGALSTSSNVTISVSTPGTGDYNIPGKIEAEDYVAMSGVVIEACSDVGGGYDVGGVHVGDWVDYDVSIQEAGEYSITYRVATPDRRAKINLLLDGTLLATTVLPTTGGWQTWESVSETITLPAGDHLLTLEDENRSWNLNWIELTKVGGSARINISEQSLMDSKVLLYPIPSSSQLFIETEESINHIKVFTTSGELIIENEIKNGSYIDVSRLVAGVYFIHVNNSIQKKFIKK